MLIESYGMILISTRPLPSVRKSRVLKASVKKRFVTREIYNTTEINPGIKKIPCLPFILSSSTRGHPEEYPGSYY